MFSGHLEKGISLRINYSGKKEKGREEQIAAKRQNAQISKGYKLPVFMETAYIKDV